MKDLNLLVWLTQLGLSAALPLAGFLLLGVWLRDSLHWGAWVVWCGLILGIVCAGYGLWDSLRAMARMGKDKKDNPPPPIAFNDHE